MTRLAFFAKTASMEAVLGIASKTGLIPKVYYRLRTPPETLNKGARPQKWRSMT
jgi:hypothetical protein